MTVPGNIYGIDFSGACNAGEKIWICHGIIKKDVLIIQSCEKAAGKFGTSYRDVVLKRLVDFILGETNAAFGLDFPFTLPEGMIREQSWESFVKAFPHRYSTPDRMRNACRSIDNRREKKRETEKVTRAPFSSYNLRIYRQTFYGIRDVLYPLVCGGHVSVLPMQEPVSGKPWVLEVCPASTLAKCGLRIPYKGNSEKHRHNRKKILGVVTKKGCLLGSRLAEKIVENVTGDALDSFIAAFAVHRVISHPGAWRPEGYFRQKEGYIYA